MRTSDASDEPAGGLAEPPGELVWLPSEAEAAAVAEVVQADLPRFIDELRLLVGIDSGSYTGDGVNEVATWTAAALVQLGADVERRPDPAGRLGDTVIGRFESGRVGPSVLVIGHMDTVFDPGTAAARPFRMDEGIAYGPGVTDMKGGLLTGLHALGALRAVADEGAARARADATPAEAAAPADGAARADAAAPTGRADWLPVGRLTFIANPDEEIGSPTSSPHIRAAALEADVALVLECARANGDIVSRRKGIVDLRLVSQGRAAHAGVEPEKGRNAVLAAAHQVVALQALAGRWPGVTVNAGVIHGGTRPNVVPEQASVEVDLRSPTRADLEAAEAEVRAIASTSWVPDVTTEVEEMGRHWPMEVVPGAERLVAQAIALARRLGFELDAAATGGASDANTTAGLGVPSLDGLGPIGGNDHAPGEYLEVDSIVPRTTLLALLLMAIGRTSWTRPPD